jgi:hypothetical protein
MRWEPFFSFYGDLMSFEAYSSNFYIFYIDVVMPFLFGEFRLIICGDDGDEWNVTLGDATLFVGEIYFYIVWGFWRLVGV